MRNLYGTSARRTGYDKHVAKIVTVNPHSIVTPRLKRMNLPFEYPGTLSMQMTERIDDHQWPSTCWQLLSGVKHFRNSLYGTTPEVAGEAR